MLTHSRDINKKLQEGEQLEKNECYLQAFEIYDRLVKDYPYSKASIGHLGSCYGALRRSGEFEKPLSNEDVRERIFQMQRKRAEQPLEFFDKCKSSIGSDITPVDSSDVGPTGGNRKLHI